MLIDIHRLVFRSGTRPDKPCGCLLLAEWNDTGAIHVTPSTFDGRLFAEERSPAFGRVLAWMEFPDVTEQPE